MIELSTCAYICVCICMYMYIYVCICVCMCVCIYMDINHIFIYFTSFKSKSSHQFILIYLFIVNEAPSVMRKNMHVFSSYLLFLF